MSQSTKGYEKFENEENKKERLTTTINAIENATNVNDAIETAKQAAHRAFKNFVEEVTELNKNPNMTESEKTVKKTEFLKKLSSDYQKIKNSLFEVLRDKDDKLKPNKFQQKRLYKLTRKVQDTATKIEISIGESANRDYNWEKVNLIGKTDFTAKDFRVFERKKSPLQKVKKFVQKAAKNREMKKNRGVVEPI